jgi:hypothetical protein
VTLVPRSANPGAYAWRVRHIIASAAGPCSNLALGVLAVLLVDLRVRSFPNILWISIGVQSLLIGLLNLRPIRIGRISSDGFTVLQLLRGGAEARRRAVLAALLAMAVDTRPREWDPALIAEIDPDHPTARLALYEWSLDRGDVAEAGRHLDHVVAMRWESFDRADAIVFNEGAYFAARHRADVARARELLARSDSDRVLPWMRARAVAATIHAEGRHDEAREIAQWGLAQLQRARPKDMALEREQLEELAGLRVPTAAVGAS